MIAFLAYTIERQIRREDAEALRYDVLGRHVCRQFTTTIDADCHGLCTRRSGLLSGFLNHLIDRRYSFELHFRFGDFLLTTANHDPSVLSRHEAKRSHHLGNVLAGHQEEVEAAR